VEERGASECGDEAELGVNASNETDIVLFLEEFRKGSKERQNGSPSLKGCLEVSIHSLVTYQSGMA